MKKIVFGLLALVCFNWSSLAQTSKVTVSSTVEDVEYKSLDTNDQRLVDYINAAVGGLKGLSLNSNTHGIYESVIHFSLDENNVLGNVITLSMEKTNPAKSSCKVCGISSALSCVKKIKSAHVGDGEYDIHVTVTNDDCVILSW